LFFEKNDENNSLKKKELIIYHCLLIGYIKKLKNKKIILFPIKKSTPFKFFSKKIKGVIKTLLNTFLI